MFTISENSGIKTKIKKGFYSGSKQTKKDLGIHNSMEALNNRIHATESNGGLPLEDTFICSRIEVLSMEQREKFLLLNIIYLGSA